MGEKLRNARLQRKWSLRRLARESGLSFTYIQQVETGFRRPSLRTLVRLCEALHLPVADVVRHRERPVWP